MRKTVGQLCLLLLTIWPVALSTPAQAADITPQVFLRTLADEALSVLSDNDLSDEARQRAFRVLLNRGFDVDAVSQFVLGRYWRRVDEVQRTQFRQVFEDYIVASYAVRLGGYAAEMFRVTGERLEDDGSTAIVHSEISQGQGPSINVDWRLNLRDGSWRVVDIVVEGVSMAVAQRSEFASVIHSSGGFDLLIDRLASKSRHLAEPRYAASR